MWQEVERRGEKVFHKSRCCFRNKRSSLSPASRCVMLPGRYPDCSEGIVYFVKKREKKTYGELFVHVLFRVFPIHFPTKRNDWKFKYNWKEARRRQALGFGFFFPRTIFFFFALCVCARPSKCQHTRGRPFDTHRARTGQMFPLQLSIHFFLAFHIRARLCCVCVCAPREKTMCAVFILGRPTQNEGRWMGKQINQSPPSPYTPFDGINNKGINPTGDWKHLTPPRLGNFYFPRKYQTGK